MTLSELVLKRDPVLILQAEAESQLEQLKGELADIDAEISLIIDPAIKQARQLSGKDTGTVDVLVQGVMVKQVVAKKVQWDQAELERIRLLIRQHNDDPDQYMDTKITYKVGEKSYAAMPTAVREVFDKARTVVPGAPIVKFDLRVG